MRKSYGLAGLGALAALGAFGVASAQPSTVNQPWPPAGVSYYGDPAVPNISGLWLGTSLGIPGQAVASNSGKTADGRPPTYLAPWPLPYTPAYQKILTDRMAAVAAGHAAGDTGSRCLPFGLPFLLLANAFPNEIVQTPGQTTFFFFNSFPVVIWTDGRGHPKDLRPSFNGHSVGHWVDDTLFIDTVGFNATAPLDTHLDPHSDDLHLKWSIRKVAPDILHVHITFYDDKAFTEPVTTTNILQRKTERKWEVLDDASCFENNGAFKDTKVEPGFMKF